MKISREDDDELILDHVPWGLTLFLLALTLLLLASGLTTLLQGELTAGLFVSVVGGGAMFAALALAAERCQLWLSRPAGTMVFRRRSVRGLREESHPLARVKGATLQRGPSRGRNRRRPTWRAALILVDGAQIPLTNTYTDGPGPERAKAAVDRWLARRPAGPDA